MDFFTGKLRRAQGADLALVMAGVVGIVAVVVTMLIGVQLNESVGNSFDRSRWSLTTNASYTTLVNNSNSGFSLLAVAPIVTAAVTVISLLVGVTALSRIMRAG